jgi:DNA-binding response OmpR family regulator
MHVHQPQTRDTVPSSVVRVLLAEDDRELRHLLAAGLRRHGYVVIEAATGFELLDRLDDLARRDETVDLIVSDVRMPGPTGLVAVEGLRYGSSLASAATPVILITAFGDVATHAEARRLGAVVLHKPFDIDDFHAFAASMLVVTRQPNFVAVS